MATLDPPSQREVQLQRMVEAGLSSPERQEGIHFASDLREIQNVLAENS